LSVLKYKIIVDFVRAFILIRFINTIAYVVSK